MRNVSIAFLLLVSLVLARPAFSQSPINVKLPPYNASGNPGGNDTNAFINAIAALPATGGKLIVPAGTYDIHSQLTISKSITIEGEGQQVTKLRWVNPTHGIVFNGAIGRTLTVRSLSVVTTYGDNPGYAIQGSWPSPPVFHGGLGFSTAVISDINIGGDTVVSGQTWEKGIVLTNATTAKISDFAIHGYGVSQMYSGIELLGASTPSYISNGDIYGVNEGIRVLDNSEGAHISHVEVVEANWGIVLYTFPGRPGTSVVNCHTNTRLRGIAAYGRADTVISGNLIYRLGEENGWVGIHLVQGHNVRVADNQIATLSPGGTREAIVVHDSNYVVVHGNNVNAMNNGVVLSGSSSQAVVTNNRIYGTGTRIVGNGFPHYILDIP